MQRQWLIVAVCVFYIGLPVLEARLCEGMSVWNNVGDFEQLRGCNVIVGSLKILLIEKANIPDYQNISFPELTEIKGYLLLYRVKGLTSLGKLFPNLSVIRGMTLITDYSLVLYDVTHLQELGLRNLKYIARGSLRIERCPNLCYIHTIDWSKIAGSSDDLHTFDMSEGDCLSCPTHCNGLCWNQEYCQQTETDNCDPECIGCRRPNDPNECYACRTYMDNQRCVSQCPLNKVRHSLLSYCVTEKECPTLLNGTWWTFQGQCVDICPPHYTQVSEEKGWCEYCGSECTKVCDGTQVDSIATAQTLRGCTYINGSLSIRIDSKSTVDELEETLGLIEEIDGYLKIYRSYPLYTLEFFKKLKVIHGRELENRRYALIVFENQNLHKLWNWDNFTIAIKNGGISFHYNPHLCLSQIEKLANITGLSHSYTDIDVSPYSNGDKTACNYMDLTVTVTKLTSRSILLTWEDVVSDSQESLHIGYLLYYIEDPLGNMTIYDESDQCADLDGWDSKFVSNNSLQINNLTPNTLYAYYIKTYASSRSIGGQTEIKRFKTLSDNPSVVLDVKAYSSNSSSVTLTWKPPQHPNGVISYYDIMVYYQEDNPTLTTQRNYCRFPPRLNSKEVVESPSNIWNNSSTNATCCKTSKSVSSNPFDDLCDRLDVFAVVDSKRGCKAWMYPILDKNKSTVNNDGVVGRQAKSYLLNNSTYITVTRVQNSNLTRYVVQPLKHFSMYVFLLKACNSDSPIQCSSPAVIYQRTLKKENADDIPSGLSVEVEDYDAIIKWSEPKEPNSIIVSYDIEHRRTDFEHSQPSRECIRQEQFALAGYVHRMRNFPPGQYSVRIKAVSLAGSGSFSKLVEFEILQPSSGSSPVVFIAPIIIILFIVALAFYYYLYHKKKHKLNHLHLITNVNPDYAGPIYIEDEWEMERDDVDISKELGQGTFGMVYSGYIKSQSLPCAVKTVNENTNVDEKMLFLNEACVMKSFSEAHHVVKLLGVVSRGEPALVVMELMGRGDLKSFLRRSRDSSSSITCAEMYRMAAEIADGMMYLAARKFVHRDLAARNCMVGADHTVKIGDFGMTRDIYETDYYRKETRGLMPVRWMSPESLADGVFTTDSDVWSYGVVLWEMATLAEQPYQGLANEQVLQFVIAQGTLERPMECSDLLYEIMAACWKWRPNQRPLFADIVEKLESNVGQNFRLVSFYHSSGGEEYRMNAKDRVYNPPALTVPLSRNKTIHWNASDDDVSLYSSLESNRPTPLLSSFQHQSKNTPVGDTGYR